MSLFPDFNITAYLQKINRVRLNACVLLSLFMLPLMSAETGVQVKPDNYSFKHLGIENGLNSNVIYSIFQDKKGFIWFGTNTGICKYDGYNLTCFECIEVNTEELINSSVNSIIQDRNGDLLVGTEGGLLRFNYHEEKFGAPFTPNAVSEAIVNEGINFLFYDENRNLWIATSNGLFVYDYDKNRVREVALYEQSGADTIFHKEVNTITKDENSKLWVGTTSGGVFQIDYSNYGSIRLRQFKNDKNNPGSINSNHIVCSFTDSKGVLWFGSINKGVNKFNTEDEGFVGFEHEKKGNSISSNAINCITEDRAGNLWFGTRGAGIDVLNTTTMEFLNLRHDPKNISTIGWNVVNAINTDLSGSVWIGSFGKGVDVWHQSHQNFNTYSVSGNNKSGLSVESILSIFEDSQKRLWVSGFSGFDVLNRENNTAINVFEVSALDRGIIRKIQVDKENPELLWLLVERGDIDLATINSSTFEVKKYRLPELHSDKESVALAMCAGGKGKVYVGTNIGLYIFDKYTRRFSSYNIRSGDMDFGSGIEVMHLDSRDNLWIGTCKNGLYRIDTRDDSYVHYFNGPEDSTGISNNTILAVVEDSRGEVWVGTRYGLNNYNYKTNSFEQHKTGENESFESIYGIIEDEFGSLWLSMNNGLVSYNPTNKDILRFNSHNGLQCNDFNPGAYYKSQSGECFFGGIKGFNSFFPEKIHVNLNEPVVVVTDFQVFNESVPVGVWKDGRGLLEKSITETEEIKLTYKESVFSFYFSVLDYAIPERNSYAYIMEGFEKEWNYVGNRRYAHYTSLEPGEYTFKVIGANCDGTWNNEGVEIKLIITPPYYSTWWFRIIISLFLIVIVIAVYRVRLHVIKKQKRELEVQVKLRTSALKKLNNSLIDKQEEIIAQKELLEVQKNELEQHRNNLEELVLDRTAKLEKAKFKAEESDRLKTAFLANMSHEIRTPMNAILGFANLFDSDRLDASDREEYVRLIHENGNELVKLIDDLIDFSSIQSGKILMQKANFSVAPVFNDLLERYNSKIEYTEKSVQLILEAEADLEINSDKERIMQVLDNLLSNAVKYTDSGNIYIGYIIDDCFIRFHVKDSGIGIPPDQKENIFKQFHKLSSAKTRLYRGVGLGLTISQYIVKALGGEMWVDSVLSEGSSFYFTIPLCKN